MFFDNEDNIISYMQSYLKDAQLFNGNSFERKILKMLQDMDNMISRNGHDVPPPDYISPKHNMMFDVMRVNDTEIKRTYNPVKQRERNMLKELQQSGLLEQINPNAQIFCSSESDKIEEHSFQQYQKNVIRVTSEHLTSRGHTDKISEIWMADNPNIKYKGFVIFDETECCFDGDIIHAYSDKFFFIAKEPLILHKPWDDKDFIQWAYDSNLDFIVWACTYKPFGKIVMEHNLSFPPIVIMDVRYPRTKFYIDYRNNHLVL